jgi:hypothetical protein
LARQGRHGGSQKAQPCFFGNGLLSFEPVFLNLRPSHAGFDFAIIIIIITSQPAG